MKTLPHNPLHGLIPFLAFNSGRYPFLKVFLAFFFSLFGLNWLPDSVQSVANSEKIDMISDSISQAKLHQTQRSRRQFSTCELH